MGNLFSSLLTVTNSMRTVQQAIDVRSNNVTNAKSPGYVRQDLLLVANPFDLESALPGGVASGGLVSSRRAYLEKGVRDQSSQEGRFTQLAENLARIEPLIDVTSEGGVAGAVNALFGEFSQWSITPNETAARQRVLDRAGDVASAFRLSAAAFSKASQDAGAEASSIVARINRLGEDIRNYNVQVRGDRLRRDDPGLDAQVHAALEELAGLVDFDVLRAEDGSFSVSLGGQTPLVIAGSFLPISATNTPAALVLRDSQGNDITGQIQSGKLRGLMDFRNQSIPAVKANLDQFAQVLADRINGVLSSGVDVNENPPLDDLFTYDTTLGIAESFSVSPLTPDELAAALPFAPGGNGNILDLASLATSPEINGFTFAQFFGDIAAQLGNNLSSARQESRTYELLLSQARQLRAAESEVDLDEEAANLIAFQRQYEANAELVRILNGLTETMINILR